MHEARLKVGPAAFRILSAWQRPVDELRRLYRDYPEAGICDFTVRLEPAKWWRRHIRPSVMIEGDYMLPDAAPLPLAQALLAAEMGMNLQMALGWRRHLLLHAGAAEKDGRAVLMTGMSGSGKSTMAAMLGERGWRYLGDEFVLVDLDSGELHPFPRPASLKNDAIGFMRTMAGEDRFGPEMAGTPKGTVRHLRPRPYAVEEMTRTVKPALLLYPRFGAEIELRDVPPGESFARLTQASTNYVALGERGFAALTSLVKNVPSLAFDFPDGESAFCRFDRLWKEMA